jgi:hypothetical protein
LREPTQYNHIVQRYPVFDIHQLVIKEKTMNVKLFIILSCAIFALHSNWSVAQEPDKQINQAMQQVWQDSHELETYMGMATLIRLKGQYEVSGMTWEAAIRHAQSSAKNLNYSLRNMSALSAGGTKKQKLEIRSIQLVAYSRLNNILAILPAPDDDELAIVTTCSGWWDCIGFENLCAELGGEFEELDVPGGVEVCTSDA